MITEDQYKIATNIVASYINQNNKPLINTNLSLEEFRKLIPTKHKSDISVYDVIIIAKDQQEPEKGFEKVIVTGHSGRDEFWGKTENQEKRAWSNNCVFKIVGSSLNIA